MENLIDREKEIEILVKGNWKKYYGEEEEDEPVYDGILDFDRYLNGENVPKILWILQEPYGDGGWHFKELIDKFIRNKKFGKTGRTWEMVLYISWSILNHTKEKSGKFVLHRWDDIPDYPLNPEMLLFLKNIAFINVKKRPNTKNSNSIRATIEEAYNQNKEILLKQIEYYNPDIIIGGNTLGFFYNDLGINRDSIVRPEGKTMYYAVMKDSLKSKNTLLIDAYHPAYREFSSAEKRKQYCDDILDAVENYLNQFAK